MSTHHSEQQVNPVEFLISLKLRADEFEKMVKESSLEAGKINKANDKVSERNLSLTSDDM